MTSYQFTLVPWSRTLSPSLLSCRCPAGLLVGVGVESVLDEDNTRQMLPDVWVMLNVAKPARHIEIFLLFLNCQVNYKAVEPVVQEDVRQGRVMSCKVDFVFQIGVEVLQQSLVSSLLGVHLLEWSWTLTTAELVLFFFYSAPQKCSLLACWPDGLQWCSIPLDWGHCLFVGLEPVARPECCTYSPASVPDSSLEASAPRRPPSSGPAPGGGEILILKK